MNNPAVHQSAEERVRSYIVILVSPSQVARARRKQWVAATSATVLELLLTFLSARSDGFSTLMGILIAAVVVSGDIRVSWIYRQIYQWLHPEPTAAAHPDERAAKMPNRANDSQPMESHADAP